MTLDSSLTTVSGVLMLQRLYDSQDGPVTVTVHLSLCASDKPSELGHEGGEVLNIIILKL